MDAGHAAIHEHPRQLRGIEIGATETTFGRNILKGLASVIDILGHDRAS